MSDERQERMRELQDNNLIVRVEQVYQLWWRWADFHLYVVSPTMDIRTEPNIILPERIPETGTLEFVYSIHDYGYRLSTSKAEEMYDAGMSMCKLYYTIEKMIFLLVERLKDGGVDTETEVQVAFGGHELPQRKAFESIINLDYNVVITNFDPGAWGDRYLGIAKNLARDGYGYPEKSPRANVYRKARGTEPSKMIR
jgi:hypothetical protein